MASLQDLIERRAIDRKGEHAGRTAAVLVEPRSGAVVYVLVAGNGALDVGPDLVPVPWQLVVMPLSPVGDVYLRTTADILARAPRADHGSVEDLSRPSVAAEIDAYYARAVAVPPASRATATGRTEPGAAGAAQADVPRPAFAAVPHILVHSDFVTVVHPPELTVAAAPVGTEVTIGAGALVVELDRPMVDLDRGRIAFVLVSQGAFLGAGGQWLPAPIEALRWSAARGGFDLALDPDQLPRLPSLARTAASKHRVLEAQIGRIYRLYDLPPYWQTAPRAPAVAAGAARHEQTDAAAADGRRR